MVAHRWRSSSGPRRCVAGTLLVVSGLDAAVAAELVSIVDREVRFRHPLVRSAVHQAAPPAQVLETYAALAEVVTDPERRIWHRAMAAVGHDEGVADALERHAVSARRRGAVMVAAAALERAAALTADPRRKGERLVRAADAAWELGAVDVVRACSQQAESLDVGELEAARLAWLQQMVSGDVWVERGAAKTFVTIARRRAARRCGYGAGLAGADRAALLVDPNSDEDTEVRRRHGAGHGISRG